MDTDSTSRTRESCISDEEVERVVRKFDSFEAADEADYAYYAGLSAAERIEIVLKLRERWYGDATRERLARVYRIVKRK